MGFTFTHPPTSTFYIWLDLAKLPSPLDSGLVFFEELLKEKVIVVPGVRALYRFSAVSVSDDFEYSFSSTSIRHIDETCLIRPRITSFASRTARKCTRSKEVSMVSNASSSERTISSSKEKSFTTILAKT